jgi:hypothetical protein
MLWISGSGVLVIWFLLKFILHKGGMVHVVLMIAVSLYIIQFAQDRRTKAYQRSLHR